MAAHNISWQKSDGKKLLMQDIRDGRVTATMDWKDVFQTRNEFIIGVSYAEAL